MVIDPKGGDKQEKLTFMPTEFIKEVSSFNNITIHEDMDVVRGKLCNTKGHNRN